VATRAITPSDKAPYLERAHPKNHVIVVTLHPDRADISAIDPQGEVFDRFSIAVRK